MVIMISITIKSIDEKEWFLHILWLRLMKMPPTIFGHKNKERLDKKEKSGTGRRSTLNKNKHSFERFLRRLGIPAFHAFL